MLPNPDTASVTTLRRASRFERGIYANLARWIRRLPDRGPDGTLVAPYVDIVRMTILIWIGASAVEVVIVHLVIPWAWLRWPLLIVSLWGLVWMLGYLAGLIVNPHLVEPTRLRVRCAHTIDVVVPISAIAEVGTHNESFPTSRTVRLVDDGQRLAITMSSQANVHLALTAPLQADLPAGRYTFTRLSFWADNPTAVTARLRELVAAQRPER